MPLFTSDTAEFRQIVPVSSFDMELFLPFLQRTESELLPRFFADSTIEYLLGLPDLTSPLPGDTKALKYLRTAIGCLAFKDYLPFAEVQIANDGITVSADTGRKAAFAYQTKRLEVQLLQGGWYALDKLIGLVATDLAFPGWADSPWYQTYTRSLFTNPAEFSKFYGIQDSWLSYWALRPYIDAIEDGRALIAQTAIDALPVGVTSTQKAVLRRKLQRAVAFQTMADALPNLSVTLSGYNVQLNYASQYGGASEYFEPPTPEQLGFVLNNLANQAKVFWEGFDVDLAALGPVDPDADQSGTSGLIGGDKFIYL